MNRALVGTAQHCWRRHDDDPVRGVHGSSLGLHFIGNDELHLVSLEDLEATEDAARRSFVLSFGTEIILQQLLLHDV